MVQQDNIFSYSFVLVLRRNCETFAMMGRIRSEQNLIGSSLLDAVTHCIFHYLFVFVLWNAISSGRIRSDRKLLVCSSLNKSSLLHAVTQRSKTKQGEDKGGEMHDDDMMDSTTWRGGITVGSCQERKDELGEVMARSDGAMFVKVETGLRRREKKRESWTPLGESYLLLAGEKACNVRDT